MAFSCEDVLVFTCLAFEPYYLSVVYASIERIGRGRYEMTFALIEDDIKSCNSLHTNAYDEAITTPTSDEFMMNRVAMRA